jgi:hypothetical protein
VAVIRVRIADIQGVKQVNKIMKMINKNKKYIVTCWHFSAPDGLEYDSIWGAIELIQYKDFLGFETKNSEIDYVVKVTGENGSFFISGYDVKGIMECNEKPIISEDNSKLFRRNAKIYIL